VRVLVEQLLSLDQGRVDRAGWSVELLVRTGGGLGQRLPGGGDDSRGGRAPPPDEDESAPETEPAAATGEALRDPPMAAEPLYAEPSDA